MSAAARAQLVQLGRDLLADGLVVRTWGNFSVRTGPDEFLITPSGRRYETMTPEDLAVVDLDGEWSGPLKPSSEHPMHAVTYRLFEEAGCVLHTHQRYASAMSLSPEDLPLDDDAAALLGQPTLPIAPYGLPSTHKLHANVEATLGVDGAHALLLRAHGALVWAPDAAGARALGNALEEVSERLYRERVGGFGNPRGGLVHSERSGPVVRWFDDGGAEASPTPATRANHERIYERRPDVGAIVTDGDPEVQAYYGRELPAYLDDFAQLAGIRADASTRHDVVLTKSAAYCLGADLEGARNVQLVLEKNARAARIADHFGTDPIVAWEAVLMRQIYTRKYSKQAG